MALGWLCNCLGMILLWFWLRFWDGFAMVFSRPAANAVHARPDGWPGAELDLPFAGLFGDTNIFLLDQKWL